jgi:ParB-like chromosome segregation protein Spo0J
MNNDPHQLKTERFPIVKLRTFHLNPRKGDVESIRESLRVNGQYKPIVCNVGTHTGRKNEVLAGNHTLMAARDEGWTDISVCWVDVDSDQASRIVAADNRTADRGGYDERLLAELLGELPDLKGTGFDQGDLDALISLLEPAADVDDQGVLDDTDRAGWPIIRCQVPPDVHQRWLLVDGEDDMHRVFTLLNEAGI